MWRKCAEGDKTEKNQNDKNVQKTRNMKLMK